MTFLNIIDSNLNQISDVNILFIGIGIGIGVGVSLSVSINYIRSLWLNYDEISPQDSASQRVADTPIETNNPNTIVEKVTDAPIDPVNTHTIVENITDAPIEVINLNTIVENSPSTVLPIRPVQIEMIPNPDIVNSTQEQIYNLQTIINNLIHINSTENTPSNQVLDQGTQTINQVLDQGTQTINQVLDQGTQTTNQVLNSSIEVATPILPMNVEMIPNPDIIYQIINFW